MSDELLRYPDGPGHRGVDTSVAAAESFASKLGRLQRLVRDAIGSREAYGATADECADLLGMDRWSVQPRTSELRHKREIIDSGLRRTNSTGKRAIVWVLPQYERRAA